MAATLNLIGITNSGNISSSISSTVGRVVATTFHGDGSALKMIYLKWIVTQSAQLAAQISGAFTEGFSFFFNIMEWV